MTSARVVEMSVNVTSNSPAQDFTHPYDHNLRIHGNIILISLNQERMKVGPKLSIVVELVLTYATFCNRNKSFKSLTIKGE